jgi:hypothetical protein
MNIFKKNGSIFERAHKSNAPQALVQRRTPKSLSTFPRGASAGIIISNDLRR